MTIKEAFEALSSACAKGMKNPFFVMKRLKESFADVADKVVDAGGSVVDVVPAQDSGYLVGNVKVDGEDNYLYAPPQIIPPHVYSDTERLVGVWFHDEISEDVYERTITDITIAADSDYTIFSEGINKAFIVNSMFEYSSGRWMSPSYLSTSATSNNRSCYVDVDNGALKLHNQSASSIKWTVTIRYTKASS